MIDEVVYVDTFFDNLEPSSFDHHNSPEKREKLLAENILNLAVSQNQTLCLLGQWHTQTSPIQLDDNTLHRSALYRIRQTEERIPFVHMIYHQGQARNDGRILNLPERTDIQSRYQVTLLSDLDFDIHVPQAHPTRLAKDA